MCSLFYGRLVALFLLILQLTLATKGNQEETPCAFQCYSSSKCLRINEVCDGYNDCLNGEDERICLHESKRSSSCHNLGVYRVIFDSSCSDPSNPNVRGCNAGNQGVNCRFCWAILHNRTLCPSWKL